MWNLVVLGELRLVAGDPAEAHHLAERALALEPFEPRGHRLALAAAVRHGILLRQAVASS